MADIDTMLAAGAAPVMAILRGILPAEAEAVGRALVASGIRLIEVPTNSPDWQDSVAILARSLDGEAAVGAGTVVKPSMARELSDAGGRFAVAPDCRVDVIEAVLASGMDMLPGVLTPTEAFTAFRAGASRLKLFPAASVATSHISALRSVLPPEAQIWAVGGVDRSNAAGWLAAGAQGVALGSSLYAPGMAPDEVAKRARGILETIAV